MPVAAIVPAHVIVTRRSWSMFATGESWDSTMRVTATGASAIDRMLSSSAAGRTGSEQTGHLGEGALELGRRELAAPAHLGDGDGLVDRGRAGSGGGRDGDEGTAEDDRERRERDQGQGPGDEPCGPRDAGECAAGDHSVARLTVHDGLESNAGR